MYTYILADNNGSNIIELPILIFYGAEFCYDEFNSNYKVVNHFLNEFDELIIYCEKIY